MPRLALALFILSFVSLFVIRSLIQYRNTGSIGLNGFHGRIGSRPWIAGVATSVAFVLAPIAPIAVLLEWPGGGLFVSNAALHGSGAVCTFVGIVGALLAQLSMGDSWRIGVDETETTTLVTTGLFGWVRNPIFSFMWILLFGLVLLVPNALAVTAAFLMILGIEIHVRAVEEPYLASTHGATYNRYAQTVGRFLPGIGRITSDVPVTAQRS